MKMFQKLSNFFKTLKKIVTNKKNRKETKNYKAVLKDNEDNDIYDIIYAKLQYGCRSKCKFDCKEFARKLSMGEANMNKCSFLVTRYPVLTSLNKDSSNSEAFKQLLKNRYFWENIDLLENILDMYNRDKKTLDWIELHAKIKAKKVTTTTQYDGGCSRQRW